MSLLPDDRRYAKSHEWALDNGDGTISVGITDHAQELLGDVVFVELPAVGRIVAAGGECALVESVKAASDIYSPISGEILAVNPVIAESPEVINQDPYGAGWLFRVRLVNPGEFQALMDGDTYLTGLD
ncbi:MAG: glycine cleavage system protein GcvH [Pseudomonadota bacterium]